jgi:hypothetical protein
MKEEDIRVDYPAHQLLLYAERSDGTYAGLQTGAYAARNYLGDFLQQRAGKAASGIEKLEKGEISSIAYYMELFGMTVADVAARAGLPVSKVRKQLLPAGFAGATIGDLRRYAEVFDIPAADFFQVIVPEKDGPLPRRKKTANPFFTILEIQRG